MNNGEGALPEHNFQLHFTLAAGISGRPFAAAHSRPLLSTEEQWADAYSCGRAADKIQNMHARRITTSRDAMSPTGLAVSWDLDPPISVPLMHCIVAAVTVTCSKFRRFFSQPDRATVNLSTCCPGRGHGLATILPHRLTSRLTSRMTSRLASCIVRLPHISLQPYRPPACRPSPRTRSCADFRPTASAGSHPPAMHHYFLLLSLLSIRIMITVMITPCPFSFDTN